MTKKSLTTVATVATFIFICTGCAAGNKEESTPKETPPVVSEEEEIDISLFKEVKTSKEGVLAYREEVTRRLATGETFVNQVDWEAIESNWASGYSVYNRETSVVSLDRLSLETTEYHYPVVFKEGQTLVLWYTGEYGTVYCKELVGHWAGSTFLGYLHTDLENREAMEVKHFNFCFTYDQSSGLVSEWRFGTEVKQYQLPAGSIYCGYSFFEGYIFRSGTDVFSLKGEEELQVVCIAHNVQYVIDADYYLSSDPWCQPLFLMTDGSIKCYVGWEDNNGTAADDDICHLLDLEHEGSYDK